MSCNRYADVRSQPYHFDAMRQRRTQCDCNKPNSRGFQMPSFVSHRLVNRPTSALLCSLAVLVTGAAAAQSFDPVVFSFATVGDSRQDPSKADPTTFLVGTPGVPSLTGTLLPQDAEYLQISAATNAILAGVQSQAPNLLFFNGDMIYGY